jgi:hypothetical protein
MEAVTLRGLKGHSNTNEQARARRVVDTLSPKPATYDPDSPHPLVVHMTPVFEARQRQNASQVEDEDEDEDEGEEVEAVNEEVKALLAEARMFGAVGPPGLND